MSQNAHRQYLKATANVIQNSVIP